MAHKKRKTLKGTRPLGHTRRRIKAVKHEHVIEALLLLRDQGAAPPAEAFILGCTHVNEREHLDHDELLARSGAGDSDLETVRKFAAEYHLEVLREDPGARTVALSGRTRDMNRAFATELHHYRMGKQEFHSHEGEVSVPSELGDIVVAVFGLDNRATARRPGYAAGSGPVPPPVDENTKPPAAFKDFYSFPGDAGGRGQCIAILEFAGGFEPEKLKTYLARLGVQTPEIIVREIGKGRNKPVNQPNTLNADVEVYMDIEIVASVASEAKIVVYFGENSEQGWIEAVNAAIFDTTHRPSVLSISWGMAEGYWKPQLMQALDDSFQKAAHLGVTICCSSGDFGVYEANEPPQPYTVAFPASSPHVLACGGTRLETSDDGATHEAVWNQSGAAGRSSGGGVSNIYGLPPFQAEIGVPLHSVTAKAGRGVPDVAANASTRTGYIVWSDETDMSMGGTSAAAPLWAGLVACLNESLDRRIGFLTPLLYTKEAQQKGALRDIVDGDNNNEQMPGRKGYLAQAGWDACTGLGTPRGEELLRWLKS